MPTEPLQIDHSVVVQSQAIADNAQLMNLGVNPMATVTSVSLARMVYGAFPKCRPSVDPDFFVYRNLYPQCQNLSYSTPLSL